jgi:ADP-ribose pyrophosphatase YjhB (NUDIX family)
MSEHRNPFPTVDIIIEVEGGIVLIERKNPPYGWAIPGGFVDYGETVEAAAVREAKEETGLDVQLTGLLGVYSDPSRDPRHHTISTVFVASAAGQPLADDDAADAGVFKEDDLPDDIAFDHRKILGDYFNTRNSESRIQNPENSQER